MSQIMIATFDSEGRKTSEITADVAAAFRIGVRDTMIEGGPATVPALTQSVVVRPAIHVAESVPAAEAPADPKRKARKRARR